MRFLASFVLILLYFACTESTYNDSHLNLDESYERTVTAVVNPNCPESICSNFTLVHVESRGRSDGLHYIWTMEKIPTFLYARTDLNTSLEIDWNLLSSPNRSQSIKFSSKPHYLAATSISKFIMFDDINDTGVLPPPDSEGQNQTTISFYPENMSWELVSSNSSGNSSASAVFRLASYEGVEVDANTNIEITLTAYGTRDRSLFLPHLMFTENTTQVDVVFENITKKHSFSNTRLALELMTMATEPEGNFSVEISRSLDDEYTPGVFKLMEVQSPLHQHFLQWRPVCYTSIVRNIGFSSGVALTPVQSLPESESRLTDSLVNWIVPSGLSPLLVQGFNVSFGAQGDGFYRSTNYTSWTMVTGHGQPLADRFSLMVILVIAVGLGLPVCVLIVGGSAIGFRNYRHRKDDLLLSN